MAYTITISKAELEACHRMMDADALLHRKVQHVYQALYWAMKEAITGEERNTGE